MAISLAKGGRVSLDKEAPGLKNIIVGLGWDANRTDTGGAFDLDASIFMLNASEKIVSDNHFVFYNNATSPCGAVVHKGDNKTGDGSGDDEVIEIALANVDPKAEKIVFIVTIHDAVTRRQNFGQVNNSYIRVINKDDGRELAKYELDENFSTETAVNFGELYRKDGGWNFKAVGAGFIQGLDSFCRQYGVNVG